MSDASNASGPQPRRRLFSILAIVIVVLPAALAGTRVANAFHLPRLVPALFVLFAFPLSQGLASWAHKRCYGPPPSTLADQPENTPDESVET